MEKLIQELVRVSERMNQINNDSMLIVDSLDFWKKRSDKLFEKIYKIENEYDPDEERLIPALTEETRSLIRRIDIEVETLSKLDREYKNLEKKRNKIQNLLNQ